MKRKLLVSPQDSCPHAVECPGCPLIDLAYPAQLLQKQALVRAQLATYPELDAVVVAPTEPAARRKGYRARAKLVTSAGKLGLFARGTHRVVDIPHCQVLDPLVAEAAAALRGILATGVLLDGVDVARAGDALLVTLIAPPETPELEVKELAATLGRAVPAVQGVALARRAPGAVQLLSGGHMLLQGVSELRARASADDPYSYVALGAFMQAHADTSQAILARVLERLSATEPARELRVLELFAGSGALALSLAARGASVTAVESFAPACERLERAAREQSLSLRVVTADATEHTRLLVETKQRFDLVLVNPPRRGLEPTLRAQLAALGARQIGYVSCRPSSLARDLAHFARLGYTCDGAAPFDMMPLTDQVETLVWLTRGEPPAPVVIHQEAALIAVHKEGHERLDALRARVRRLPGCERAVASSSLAFGSSGLVLFSPSDTAAATFALMTQSTFGFVALVKGVVHARGALPNAGAEPRGRYRRLQVVLGHSLVEVDAASDEQVLRAFRRLGHPVLGDGRDGASARHFSARHGLDRPFLHGHRLLCGLPERNLALRAPLAPDLAAVLDSMGGSALAQSV